jgi:hypothetical protein
MSLSYGASPTREIVICCGGEACLDYEPAPEEIFLLVAPPRVCSAETRPGEPGNPTCLEN